MCIAYNLYLNETWTLYCIVYYFKHLWSLSVSGLVCSVLLQKLSKKAKNVEENSLSTDLAEHAKYSKTLLYYYIFMRLKMSVIQFITLFISQLVFLSAILRTLLGWNSIFYTQWWHFIRNSKSPPLYGWNITEMVFNRIQMQSINQNIAKRYIFLWSICWEMDFMNTILNWVNMILVHYVKLGFIFKTLEIID